MRWFRRRRVEPEPVVLKPVPLIDKTFPTWATRKRPLIDALPSFAPALGGNVRVGIICHVPRVRRIDERGVSCA